LSAIFVPKLGTLTEWTFEFTMEELKLEISAKNLHLWPPEVTHNFGEFWFKFHN